MLPSGQRSVSMTCVSKSVWKISSARWCSRSFWSGVCAESSMSWSMRARASPPCSTSFSTMECVIFRCGTSVSGSASMSLSKVLWFQFTKPSGAFLRLIFFSFFGSPPALAMAFWFSISNSGASAITSPSVSKPIRPARPAIWWNSRALSLRILLPSYLVRAVSTTEWMGTLMPTPSVSVPQITDSRPCWASCSTSLR